MRAWAVMGGTPHGFQTLVSGIEWSPGRYTPLWHSPLPDRGLAFFEYHDDFLALASFREAKKGKTA